MTSRQDLLSELVRVREDGFAVLDGELETGLFSLSVPVRHRSGALLGAMAAYGPTERMKLLGARRIADELQRASAEVQQALSAMSPPATGSLTG
ncbi:IclR family transcriptional regulator domain-containing protein [Glutamicibacter sp. TV12E]|uniref:IclR family transcriptional regulator domain-containing protein n=1 Tax=Glutamicibacter sp. TV12E TaxID=3446362 RepID=UPI004033C5BD